MHPTELQGCKPVPQVGAPCHPETARAREQHPEARLWSNAPFEMVESFEPLRRWRGATNERHHDSGDERDTAHPHGYREDMKHSCNSEVVHPRSEEHTSELQSLMRISYAVFCLKKKKNITIQYVRHKQQQHNK